MSNSVNSHPGDYPCNRPFTGKGIAFDPLGVQPGRTGLILHETGFLPANANWNYVEVLSPFWRLHHNWASGHSLRLGARQVELTPKHLVLTPPHSLIELQGEKPVGHLWMHFNFTRQIQAGRAIPIQLPLRDTEHCLLRDLKELILSHGASDSTEAVYRNSLALLQVVLARPDLEWQAAIPANLARVREHIVTHIRDKLPVPLLANLAGMSEASLNRAFQKHFAATPARYVSELRTREVARLLEQTQWSIDEIADQTGFPNRAYLSRAFKQMTGRSPAAFRHNASHACNGVQH